MATNSQGDSVTKTISMESGMGKLSDARARALGFRSYSAYIQSLLRKDLDERKDIVLREMPPAYRAGAKSSSTSAAETDEKVLAVIKTGVKYPRLKRRKKTA